MADRLGAEVGHQCENRRNGSQLAIYGCIDSFFAVYCAPGWPFCTIYTFHGRLVGLTHLPHLPNFDCA